MPPERLQQIKQAAQRAGDCNGWTGTSGTLARYIMELLAERHRYVTDVQVDLERTQNARKHRIQT